ncbi:MAG: N-(5'-phosphoribosyl)anthranilate isomerase, partial [Dehalococcoidia bacterium]|nr:N-(5'-phosphoribosyl)anthranilate isomerase [Dehalococcoidia bacterium]
AGTANKKNIFLGGGLNPENVISAIKKVEPWGVDVSTGVEKNGEKDSLLIRSFIKNVKSVTS